MIPKFPNFVKLDLNLRNELGSYFKKYPPYSDFNFVSLYSYDTFNLCALSFLNCNLVIRFSDYIDNKPFYSFLGNNNLENTLNTLIRFSINGNLGNILKLVPECNFDFSDSGILKKFKVEESLDSRDYILSTKAVLEMNDKKIHGKKKRMNKFISEADVSVKDLNLTDLGVQKDILELFELWARKKNRSDFEIKTEFKAIERLLSKSAFFDLYNIGIYIKDKMVAFTINELVQGDYAMAHFGKYNPDFEGSFEFAEQQTSERLFNQGARFLNYEQDLGIDSLRDSKKQWNPIKFLRKYQVSQLVD